MRRCSTWPMIREMQIKATVTSLAHLLRWLLSERQTVTGAGEDVEDWNVCAKGREKAIAAVESGVAMPQSIKWTAIWSSESPKIKSRGSNRYICPPTSTAALFTMAKRQKQPKCPLTYERVNKMWRVHNTHAHTHTLESRSYSACRNDLRTHAPAGISLEHIRLSEINRAQKNRYIVWFHLSKAHSQTDRDRKQKSSDQGLGVVENRQLLFNGCRASIRKMKMFWRWTVVTVAQQCQYTSYYWTVYFKMIKMLTFKLGIFYHNFLNGQRIWASSSQKTNTWDQ